MIIFHDLHTNLYNHQSHVSVLNFCNVIENTFLVMLVWVIICIKETICFAFSLCCCWVVIKSYYLDAGNESLDTLPYWTTFPGGKLTLVKLYPVSMVHWNLRLVSLPFHVTRQSRFRSAPGPRFTIWVSFVVQPGVAEQEIAFRNPLFLFI